MSLQGPMSAEWFRRARRCLVNGVSSGFRYWGDDDTLVVDRAEGAYLYDTDGRRFIDYQLGYGPIILGHADPGVMAAVAAAAGTTSLAMTQRREVEAAERFLEAVTWASRIRFTNTGTEATMHAVRLARGYTGRELILKFEGQYHGMHDYVLFSVPGTPADLLGSRSDPIPFQASSGIPDAIRSTVRTLPFNDIDAVEQLFRWEGIRIAGVLVEPVLGNAFAIPGRRDFLARLRSLCDEHGTVLIFDEVKTGFRTALGGAFELYGVAPDVGTFAKAMGNGFPVAAIAVTEPLADAWIAGGIGQAGTYSGNGVSVAAAEATISRLLTGEPYEQITRVGTALMEGLSRILADQGVAGRVVGHPSMFSIYLGDGEPIDARSADDHDADLYERVIKAMIRRGVMPVWDAEEPWFVSAAHSDADVATTLEAFEVSLREEKG